MRIHCSGQGGDGLKGTRAGPGLSLDYTFLKEVYGLDKGQAVSTSGKKPND